MKPFSANIEDLRSLCVLELRKALDMEQKVTKSLPRIIANCTDQALSSALENHLNETEQHVVKVERLLEANEEDVSPETCKAIGGLATEAEDSIKNANDSRNCGIRCNLDSSILPRGQSPKLMTWCPQS